jgi:hypothetical protein
MAINEAAAALFKIIILTNILAVAINFTNI